MESKREATRLALMNGFKSLMMDYPFEKITIKMITDEAGYIRPTFYNYFYDKYEVLEWIFKIDVEDYVNVYMDNGDFYKGLLTMFERIEENKDFYIRALNIKGQNDFTEIIRRHIYENFSRLYDALNLNTKRRLRKKEILDKDLLCRYYANGLVFMVKTWTEESADISPREWTEKYCVLIDVPVVDVMKRDYNEKLIKKKMSKHIDAKL